MKAVCKICGNVEEIGYVAGVGNPRPGQKVNVGCGECGGSMVRARED